MDEMVVSATRTEISLDKVGGNSVTVITSDEIQAKQQNSVAELLKTVPGVSLVSSGGPGTVTSVFTRGADSKNTLILVDGIMLNDVSGRAGAQILPTSMWTTSSGSKSSAEP